MGRPRKYYYHCSSRDHGMYLDVKHLIPTYKSEKEPNVPRLCVCRDVVSCFTARLFPEKNIYVYRTIKPVKGIRPKNLWDWAITGEMWLIPPQRLIYYMCVPYNIVIDATHEIRTYHRITKQNSNFNLRICQSLLAMQAMPDLISNFTKTWIERLAKERNITHDYIQELINATI